MKKNIKQEVSSKDIELKSPAVQEILGRPPRWMIRWGISIVFILVSGLIVGSYFFKYPDVISATITVTKEELPNECTKILGKILISPKGSGKVKIGQNVNVKFDNYPYMEFGIIKITIENDSLLPVTINENQKAYMLEIVLPDELITNYGNELIFCHEMIGSAEIITEDLRLLDRFWNPIKAIIKQ
jgi:HlyD family secretion protein